MRKLFTILVCLLFTFAMYAQDSGEKLSKQAGRALATYNMAPSDNAAKLEEAFQKIDQAITMPDAASLSSVWLTRGDIYSKRLDNDMNARMLNPEAKFTGNNDALIAFEAYNKVLELAEKKFEKKDAVKGIAKVQRGLINIGADKYDKKDYQAAFKNFDACLVAHRILQENSEPSVLDDPEQYKEQLFYTAVAAQLANETDEAIRLYELQVKNGQDRPEVYDGLYSLFLTQKDTTSAMKSLEKGRAKFPDDTQLLFTEINVYLQNNKLDELTGRLKTAIEKEPTNISLYLTLGSVYDNLYQREQQPEGNKTKGADYFEQAKNYYQQAIDKDPTNADAAYSMGTLYYNQAALLTQEMVKLESDYSADGIKKFKVIQDEVMGLFDKALPYFKKAESLDPNEVGTLTALSEIFARKDQLDLAKEFKSRLETVQSGKKVSAPYFKN